MRYKPKIGQELALTAAVKAARTKHLTEVTRSAIALAVVFLALASLAVAATICTYRDDFQMLHTLWAVIAAPLGCVIGYYFRGTGANGEENHTRAA
jgi:hypothetical protein